MHTPKYAILFQSEISKPIFLLPLFINTFLSVRQGKPLNYLFSSTVSLTFSISLMFFTKSSGSPSSLQIALA